MSPASGRTPNGPIIVLTFPHAGDRLLENALSASRAVTCTHTTGLLPLCFSAVNTWQSIENRGSELSALAVKSIRTLVNTMAVVVESGSGTRRWCETAYTGSVAAEAFLSIFPEAAFLCLHRSLQAVFADGIRAYPWGLGGSPFWQYAGPHPGNNVATIAAYWAAHTEPLLHFEARHPQSSIRIRYEDLVTEGGRVPRTISDFLGLNAGELLSLDLPGTNSSEKYGNTQLVDLLDRLPDWLHGKVAELHARLNYHNWHYGE